MAAQPSVLPRFLTKVRIELSARLGVNCRYADIVVLSVAFSLDEPIEGSLSSHSWRTASRRFLRRSYRSRKATRGFLCQGVVVSASPASNIREAVISSARLSSASSERV
jgi:hypothetical protein